MRRMQAEYSALKTNDTTKLYSSSSPSPPPSKLQAVDTDAVFDFEEYSPEQQQSHEKDETMLFENSRYTKYHFCMAILMLAR